MRIACFGPLPPRGGDVGESWERLVAELSQLAEVGVLVEGYTPRSDAIRCRCRIHDLARLHYRHVLSAYDVVLYPLAGGRVDDSAREALGEWPGVVAIRDAQEGSSARDSDIDRSVLERALAVVVESPAIAERLSTDFPWTAVFLVEGFGGRFADAAKRYLEICRQTLARGARWLEPLFETACAEIPGFVPGERKAPWREEVDELARLVDRRERNARVTTEWKRSR